MFRTRDFMVVVVALILTLFVAVVAIILSPREERPDTPKTDVLLGTPRDTYEVVPYEETNTLRDERDAFIEKVKQNYVPPVVVEEEIEDPYVFESTTPPPVLLPPVTVPQVEESVPVYVGTTTPYGNTSI